MIRTPKVPFSNGTEESAWLSSWCEYCAHDHDMHGPAGAGPGCDIVIGYMVGVHDKDWRWPEAWLPEPDDGDFYLPSRMCCLMFTPCEPCGGDPGADERARRVDDVVTYWRQNAKSPAEAGPNANPRWDKGGDATLPNPSP